MSAASTPIVPFDSTLRGHGLCEPFVTGLFVDGASISVFDFAGSQVTVCASDATAARAESLQFELGEGPHWEALATGAPVMCPDITKALSGSWPVFAGAAQDAGIAAAFAFPMRIGAATVGVVDLYCAHPRWLDAHQISLASSMADRVAIAAVRMATRMADDPHAAENDVAPALRREVHQATGMIQAQLEVSATEALTRLRSRAFATGMPIGELAASVVAGRTDFSALPD